MKKFHYELDRDNFNTFTSQDRLDQLKRMYKETEGITNHFRSGILLEILAYGKKLDTCYKEYFIEYLKTPASSYCMVEDKTYELYGNNWDTYFNEMISRNDYYISYEYHENLLKYYLEAFYRSGTDISEYKGYFNKDFFKGAINNIKFINGEQLDQDEVDFALYEELGSKVMINILESNPKSFKVDEKIKILCELKNTPTVYIKLYEFNSENYYRTTLSQFYSEINLDGLEPLVERKEEFKEPPQMKFRHQFEIPEIDKKSGLFVVDFISNGYSSRAVIKKGSLTLVDITSREGHICQI